MKRLAGGLVLSLSLAGGAWAQATPGGGGAPHVTAWQTQIQKLVQQGAQLQQVPEGVIVTPASSIAKPEDTGLRAHTFTKLLFPVDATGPHVASPALNAPPFSGYGYETPSSLVCIYELVTRANGCDPNVFHTNTTGGSKAIAIVDAYHAPNARADLVHYAAQFGLPAITASNFVIWFCGTTVASCNQTTPPPYNSGWEEEISLDVQMAKAVAPRAKMFLVEANSNSYADLLVAVDKAKALVTAAGGGEISLSWGSAEFAGETSNDSHFTGATNVVFFASSGDDPSVSWPSASPFVVSVGGQSISRDPVTLDLVGESAWYDAGTGPSTIYARPSFQSSIAALIGNHRATPDVSAVANPRTGVWVYVSNQGGWLIFGGTSVASPVFAAIANNAGHFSASTTAEHSLIYANLGNTGAYGDITQGICGPYTGYWAATGWDFCTGVGSPHFKVGK